MTDLFSVGTPVGVTELIIVFRIQKTRRYYITFFLFYRYRCTRRYYWTYTSFTDTEVLVGTAELNQIQEYP